MSRFRTKGSSITQKIVNRAGGEAFKESPELELVSLLLTSFLKDKYYESGSEQLERLQSLVQLISDKKFIAQSAIYARTKFGMRSITHALVGELVRVVKGESWVKSAIEKIVYRADDCLEMLGYYLSLYGKPIPNSLKKGLALSLKKFDAYQLAKYKGASKNLKLVDLINLLHPKPTKETEEIFKKLMKGELKSDQTWETKLTQAGQKVQTITDETEKVKELSKLKKEAWTDLIKNKKLGYFALLRNLRNILQQAPEVIDEAIATLTDEKLIRKSLVLPFRFSTALKEIEAISEAGTRKVVKALHDALDLSLANVPKFEGHTLIALDESGSMDGNPFEIGSLFAAVIYKVNENAELVTFDDEAKFKNLNSTDSVMSIAKRLQSDQTSGGTDFHSIFRLIDKAYDRIIFLSDSQGWIDYNAPTADLEAYKKRMNVNTKIYSFDLNGYGDLQFPEKNVFCLAGFSDKTLELMKLLETDRNALVNEIKKIEL